jgi:hypothetical protein
MAGWIGDGTSAGASYPVFIPKWPCTQEAFPRSRVTQKQLLRVVEDRWRQNPVARFATA